MPAFILDGRYIQDHFPGIGRYVFNLASALGRIAPDDRFRLVHDPRLLNTRFDISSLGAYPNIQLLPVDAPTFSLREQLLALNARMAERAVLWHSAYYVMPYLLSLPVVLTLEDVIPLLFPAEVQSAGRRLLYRLLATLAARRARSIITLSHAAARDIECLLRIPRRKLSVVPLAASARFRPVASSERAHVRGQFELPDRFVLYVGSNKPHKNLARLFRAWAKVETDAVLVIAGHRDPGDLSSDLQVAASPGQGRLCFLPDVPEQALPGLMGSATAFVFPSLHEGFGLPPLEAMACGTPVACSNASSLPELVGDAALLFDPANVDSIASALARLLDDPGLRAALTEKGLARASTYSWERTARETLAIYRNANSSRL